MCKSTLPAGAQLGIAASFFVLMGVASPAAAQEGGFEGGLRLGYGVPLGDVSDDGTDNELSDGVSGIIPIWLDAGYRINGNVFLGGFFQYGFGFIGDSLEDTCDMDGVDCSASSLRLGAQVHYHIAPRAPADPWLGYGLGYEWLNVNASYSNAVLGDVDVSTTASGFEFANFQAGLDFMATDNFYIGPFLSFSLGQYDSADYDCDGTGCGVTPTNADIDDKALHEWFVFGIRGGYTGFVR